ncbi:MAG: SURF1 family protein [Pseudohongiellaceae bacterium]
MAASWRWQFNWKIGAFFALFFPLMIALGFWQLDREAQKRVMLEQQIRQQQQDPVPVGDVDWQAGRALAFLPVEARGRYLEERSFLLDNRLRDSRVGYEVLTPFETGDGTILVNRGWVPLGESRQQLPDVPDVSGEQAITGHLYVPEGQTLVLGDQADPLGDRWPRRIQRIDLPRLSEPVGQDLLPHTLRLDADAPGALVTDWTAELIQPEAHMGYAVQWFAMAAALLILFLYSSLTRKEGS